MIEYCYATNNNIFVLELDSLTHEDGSSLDEDDLIIVAEVEWAKVSDYINGLDIIRQIQHSAQDDVEFEIDWLDDFNEIDKLNEVILGVIKEYKPNFFFTRRHTRMTIQQAKTLNK